MKRVVGAGVVVVLIAMGCSKNPAGVTAPDELTLYSIDGRDEGDGRGVGVKATGETFQGYPVLGKFEVKDAVRRRELATALADAIERGKDRPMAKCFWPRHGFRLVRGGQVTEYVVCFECSIVQRILAGTKGSYEPIDVTTQPTFDKPLLDAGIPIAPK